ncbi:hypothetical protein [Blastopirellula retiformator]|uniref:DUF1963 domain-containing protein n=1 Tax=Blastopirellula retiformator TaxID=2527970 RepID=A0A5C5VN22_9BACT|nr:hypothetical protein [Blastopirellula retiformator]TWT39457.1 hypothetical protein Enr8_11560 [Blastopirellula retiformator]
MSQSLSVISAANRRPFRLVPSASGRHQFGGSLPYHGLCPAGSDVPVQLLASLALTDEAIPFVAEPTLKRLPLYYPFKYGSGGGAMQYGIVSDNEIRILWIGDEQADEPDYQCLQVEQLPSMPLDLVPLAYEEARILGFLRSDGYFQPNAEDNQILDDLDINHLISCGGGLRHVDNSGPIVCRNPACDQHNLTTAFQPIAMIPPIPVNGEEEFWYEYQGAYMDFCFVLCEFCGTVITFNVAS